MWGMDERPGLMNYLVQLVISGCFLKFLQVLRLDQVQNP